MEPLSAPPAPLLSKNNNCLSTNLFDAEMFGRVFGRYRHIIKHTVSLWDSAERVMTWRANDCERIPNSVIDNFNITLSSVETQLFEGKKQVKPQRSGCTYSMLEDQKLGLVTCPRCSPSPALSCHQPQRELLVRFWGIAKGFPCL